MKPTNISNNVKTFVFCLIIILSLGLLWLLRDIILLLLICFIFSESLNSIVTKLEKFKIPRQLAIILTYVLIIAFFSIIIVEIVPILATQTSDLISVLPETIKSINIFGLSALDLSSQFKVLENIPVQIATALINFVSNIFSGFVVLVISYYFLLQRPHLKKRIVFLSEKNQNIVLAIFAKLDRKLGGWVIGELILMTIIGVVSYAGFLILGLPYALPLAIIAGILEIVPNIGPIITSIVTVIVGLTISPFIALMTVILGIAVHQAENDFITPKIMQETVGMSPIITILAIATGAKLAGIGGAVLAIPLYLTAETIISTVWKNKN